MKDILSIIEDFKKDLLPKERYSSFDYCFNYFRQNKDLTADMERSCLVLGFYLASWGMLRGSSFLLQKSIKYYEPTIEYISGLDKSVWNIDVDNYTPENIEIVLDIYNEIREKLIPENKAHLTLVTKILLGVFGFIPAFDQYFCYTFRELFKKNNCSFSVINDKSLNCIKDFYEENRKDIDKLSNQTYTLNFLTGGYTNINYTKAKIIDMYGFNYGLKIKKQHTT